MTGGSPFNADLFAAEHLMVEDEAAETSLKARRTFGALIKSVTVNDEQRLHAKGRDAIMLKPFWRLTITTNDETENLMVLPPIDCSLEDKITLLKADQAEIPMPTHTPEERDQFWSALVSQVPAMIHWLVNDFVIPDNLVSQRFGITHYHHPELLESLDELAPETRLLRLIETYATTLNMWVGTASQLQAKLTDSDSRCCHEARQLLSWPNACGTYLGRLAKKHPARFEYTRSTSERIWTIHQQRTATMTP